MAQVDMGLWRLVRFYGPWLVLRCRLVLRFILVLRYWSLVLYILRLWHRDAHGCKQYFKGYSSNFCS